MNLRDSISWVVFIVNFGLAIIIMWFGLEIWSSSTNLGLGLIAIGFTILASLYAVNESRVDYVSIKRNLGTLIEEIRGLRTEIQNQRTEIQSLKRRVEVLARKKK